MGGCSSGREKSFQIIDQPVAPYKQGLITKIQKSCQHLKEFAKLSLDNQDNSKNVFVFFEQNEIKIERLCLSELSIQTADVFEDCCNDLFDALHVYCKSNLAWTIETLKIVNQLAKILFKVYATNKNFFITKKKLQIYKDKIEELQKIILLGEPNGMVRFQMYQVLSVYEIIPTNPHEALEIVQSGITGLFKSAASFSVDDELIDAIKSGAIYLYNEYRKRQIRRIFSLLHYLERLKFEIIEILDEGEDMHEIKEKINGILGIIGETQDWQIMFGWVRFVFYILNYRIKFHANEIPVDDMLRDSIALPATDEQYIMNHQHKDIIMVYENLKSKYKRVNELYHLQNFLVNSQVGLQAIFNRLYRMKILEKEKKISKQHSLEYLTKLSNFFLSHTEKAIKEQKSIKQQGNQQALDKCLSNLEQFLDHILEKKQILSELVDSIYVKPQVISFSFRNFVQKQIYGILAFLNINQQDIKKLINEQSRNTFNCLADQVGININKQDFQDSQVQVSQNQDFFYLQAEEIKFLGMLVIFTIEIDILLLLNVKKAIIQNQTLQELQVSSSQELSDLLLLIQSPLDHQRDCLTFFYNQCKYYEKQKLELALFQKQTYFTQYIDRDLNNTNNQINVLLLVIVRKITRQTLEWSDIISIEISIKQFQQIQDKLMNQVKQYKEALDRIRKLLQIDNSNLVVSQSNTLLSLQQQIFNIYERIDIKKLRAQDPDLFAIIQNLQNNLEKVKNKSDQLLTLHSLNLLVLEYRIHDDVDESTVQEIIQEILITNKMLDTSSDIKQDSIIMNDYDRLFEVPSKELNNLISDILHQEDILADIKATIQQYKQILKNNQKLTKALENIKEINKINKDNGIKLAQQKTLQIQEKLQSLNNFNFNKIQVDQLNMIKYLPDQLSQIRFILDSIRLKDDEDLGQMISHIFQEFLEEKDKWSVNWLFVQQLLQTHQQQIFKDNIDLFETLIIKVRALEEDPRVTYLFNQNQQNIQAIMSNQFKDQAQIIEEELLINIKEANKLLKMIEEETNRQNKDSLQYQYKQLQTKIANRIKNVSSVGQALQINVQYLENIQSTLASMDSKLNQITKGLEQLDKDIQYIKGKNYYELLMARKTKVLQQTQQEVYVQLRTIEKINDKENPETPLFSEEIFGDGEINEFIWKDSKDSMLIHGPAGSGKSLAAQKIELFIWQYQSKNQIPLIPILIQLATLKDPVYGAVEETLKSDRYLFDDKKIQDLKDSLINQQIRLLIILDSYDELQPQYIKLNLIQSNKLYNWGAEKDKQRFPKIITTTRSEILSSSDYYLWFIAESDDLKYYKEIRIVDFNQRQIEDFIVQFSTLQLQQLLKDQLNDVEDAESLIQNCLNLVDSEQELFLNDSQISRISQLTKIDLHQVLSQLWSPKQYMKILKDLDILQIITTPFMLKIMIEVLPKIAEQSQGDLKRNFLQNFDDLADQFKINVDKKLELWQKLSSHNNFMDFIYQNRLLVSDQIYLLLKRQIPKLNNRKFISQCLESKRLTQYDFYHEFMNIYFQKQLQKMQMLGKSYEFESMKEDLWYYCKQLACELSLRNLTQVQYKPHGILSESKKDWRDRFFNDKKNGDYKRTIRKCIPISQRNSFYQFIHKSIQEFLIAKEFLHIINKDDTTDEDLSNHFINQINISHLNIVSNFIKQQAQNLQSRLLRLVKLSVNPKFERVSSNALYILNLINFTFYSIDLSNIRISDINLSKVQMIDCNLKGSQLKNCNLSNANFSQSKLDQSLWTDINLNEYLVYQFDFEIIYFQYLRNSKSFLIQDSKNKITLFKILTREIKNIPVKCSLKFKVSLDEKIAVFRNCEDGNYALTIYNIAEDQEIQKMDFGQNFFKFCIDSNNRVVIDQKNQLQFNDQTLEFSDEIYKVREANGYMGLILTRTLKVFKNNVQIWIQEFKETCMDIIIFKETNQIAVLFESQIIIINLKDQTKQIIIKEPKASKLKKNNEDLIILSTIDDRNFCLSIWDIQTQQKKNSIKMTGDATCQIIDHIEQTILALSQQNSQQIRYIDYEQIYDSNQDHQYENPYNILLIPDNEEEYFISAVKNKLSLWNAREYKLIGNELIHSSRDFEILCLQFRIDDQTIVYSGGSDHQIIMWDIALLQKMRAFNLYRQTPKKIIYDHYQYFIFLNKEQLLCIFKKPEESTVFFQIPSEDLRQQFKLQRKGKPVTNLISKCYQDDPILKISYFNECNYIIRTQRGYIVLFENYWHEYEDDVAVVLKYNDTIIYMCNQDDKELCFNYKGVWYIMQFKQYVKIYQYKFNHNFLFALTQNELLIYKFKENREKPYNSIDIKDQYQDFFVDDQFIYLFHINGFIRVYNIKSCKLKIEKQFAPILSSILISNIIILNPQRLIFLNSDLNVIKDFPVDATITHVKATEQFIFLGNGKIIQIYDHNLLSILVIEHDYSDYSFCEQEMALYLSYKNFIFVHLINYDAYVNAQLLQVNKDNKQYKVRQAFMLQDNKLMIRNEDKKLLIYTLEGQQIASLPNIVKLYNSPIYVLDDKNVLSQYVFKFDNLQLVRKLEAIPNPKCRFFQQFIIYIDQKVVIKDIETQKIVQELQINNASSLYKLKNIQMQGQSKIYIQCFQKRVILEKNLEQKFKFINKFDAQDELLCEGMTIKESEITNKRKVSFLEIFKQKGGMVI